MTIAEQLARAKTDLDDVYEAGYNKGLTDAPPSGDYQDGFEAGKQAEYDAFWDGYQEKGLRKTSDFLFAGNGWTKSNLIPKYDIQPTRANQMFSLSGFVGDLAQHFENLGRTLDFSNCIMASGIFANASSITRIGVLDFSKVTYGSGWFANMRNLETIDKLIFSEDTVATGSSFESCSKLANITIEGTINKSINFAACPLTYESMKSIYEHLKDYTSASGTYTLTLNATAWARWDAAKPDLVAQYGSMKNYVTTTKGWATS
jgi:hypothetical protein